MIPRASVTAWRKNAPWPDNTQVEQDLVLSRALWSRVHLRLVSRLPGDPWKGDGDAR